MKTPAGKDCRYYYEDFHRGRDIQECRLLKRNQGPSQWETADCAKCPVPEILWANASQYLDLVAEVRTGILGFNRRVQVAAYCNKHDIEIEDPYIGCQKCAAERPDLGAFFQEIDS